MNRYISKSYTTSKNAIDRQYTERGQLVVSAVTGFYDYSLWWPLYEEEWKPSQSTSVKVTTKVAMFSVLLILCRSLQNVIIYIKNYVIVERDNCLLGKI